MDLLLGYPRCHRKGMLNIHIFYGELQVSHLLVSAALLMRIDLVSSLRAEVPAGAPPRNTESSL